MSETQHTETETDEGTIDYVVVVRVRPTYGSPLGAAIFQGYGDEWMKALVQSKLNASATRLEVRSVTEVPL